MRRSLARFLIMLLVPLLAASCSSPQDNVSPGGGEGTSEDDPVSTLVYTVDLPPTAFAPVPSLNSDHILIYQPALGNVLSILPREGEPWRLPGHGHYGLAVWHGQHTAYLSADGDLEPDVGKGKADVQNN